MVSSITIQTKKKLYFSIWVVHIQDKLICSYLCSADKITKPL